MWDGVGGRQGRECIRWRVGQWACKCQQGRVGAGWLCVAVNMRCLMECGADCDIGEQAGQAIGKALESNSMLQSLDLGGELGVGLARAGACILGGWTGPSTWMEQPGPCVCARENEGRMVHVGVEGDVECAMGCEEGRGGSADHTGHWCLCKCQQSKGALRVAVCMRCLIECGAGCSIKATLLERIKKSVARNKVCLSLLLDLTSFRTHVCCK